MKEIEYKDALGKNNLYDTNCPILFALKLVGQKWKLPILWHLLDNEVLHYNELKRQVKGITNTMLTKSLRELETDGLVFRHQYNTIPPSVEYTLTEDGKTLLPTLNELYHWGTSQIELNKQKDNC